jgi:WD40 repeat protein
VENIATFGTPSESCLISSSMDSALGSRLVNGQTEYLLALTDLESQNINLWNLATKENIQTFDSNDVDSVLFHPDNQTLISFSRYEPGRLTLWDIQDRN